MPPRRSRKSSKKSSKRNSKRRSRSSRSSNRRSRYGLISDTCHTLRQKISNENIHKYGPGGSHQVFLPQRAVFTLPDGSEYEFGLSKPDGLIIHVNDEVLRFFYDEQTRMYKSLLSHHANRLTPHGDEGLQNMFAMAEGQWDTSNDPFPSLSKLKSMEHGFNCQYNLFPEERGLVLEVMQSNEGGSNADAGNLVSRFTISEDNIMRLMAFMKRNDDEKGI